MVLNRSSVPLSHLHCTLSATCTLPATLGRHHQLVENTRGGRRIHRPRRVATLNRRHFMANPTGSFIWYELMPPDPDPATSFSRAVVGWTIGPADPGRSDGMDYRMIGRSDGKHAGGV